MIRSFELMDVDSGNLVGSYESIEDVLSIARASYAKHGLEGIRGLAVVAVRDDGTQELVSDDLDILYQVVKDNSVSQPV